MSERNKSDKMNSSKPVPMKLFAAWEVDRTPSNCIPRLCTLRVTRLSVCGAVGEAGGAGGGGGGGGGVSSGSGGGAVILAARMHSSKRTLRSNDITVPPHDVELDLCFSLQYPHFVKRDGNRLQIMLQRRKKYKNRTILGYKTLAEGVIRMDQVLQRSMDMELELTGVSSKGLGTRQPVARLTITGLASTPVDHDTKNNTLLMSERGYSDEEEEGEFSSVEEGDEVTYGAPAPAAAHGPARHARRPHRQLAYNKADLSYTKQRNLRQKFAALLRRFRVPEELSERGAARDTHRACVGRDIDELFQELESLSCGEGEGEDSGPDQMDTISIGSTPKPSLRPFFSSSRSLATQDHHRLSNVTRHASAAGAAEVRAARDRQLSNVIFTESEVFRSSPGEERGSEGNSDGDMTAEAAVSGASVSSSPPNDLKEEKRSRLFRSATSGAGGPLPVGVPAPVRKKASLVVSGERPVSAHELPAQSPTTLEPRRTVTEQVARVVGEEGPAPECVAAAPAGCVAAALQALGVPALVATPPHVPDVRALLQALLTRTTKQSYRRGCVRVAVCGGEQTTAMALRAHTELAARRPHDAPPIRYYLIPYGPNTVCRQLAAADSGYAALFGGDTWAALCDASAGADQPDLTDICARIARYLNSAIGVTYLPIGEAMLAYRERSGDEDASQTFVPFVAEVRVGCSEGVVSSLEMDEGAGGGGSPPARPSPPGTPAPAVAAACPPNSGQAEFTLASGPTCARHEPLELQLDYWLVQAGGTRGAEVSGDSKVTVKASFRALHVSRQNAHFTLTYVTKEKKQKIMRLGKKKEKSGEPEPGRAVVVEGVARLICSAKGSHNAPLKVYIDGTEWNGVKFFQLSTQWQTHVKTFPVATCGVPLAPLAPSEA